MRPYAIKKQHNPLRTILQFLILMIMILCSVNSGHSQSCNYAVKRVQIHSEFTKGHIRIENRRVIAKKCNEDCINDFIYTVTIDRHYMLLYHVKSSMFICWNKSFTKLVARLNPINLTYCKFEEQPSKIQVGSHVRYTSVNHQGKQVEIRFNRAGFFPTPKRLDKCVRHKHHLPKGSKFRYGNLDLANLTEAELQYYRNLTSRCASPDFLPKPRSDRCESHLRDFCTQMRILKDKGHNVTFELTDLCKNEWSRKN